MKFFKKRESKFVDWTEKLRNQQEQVDQMRSEMSSESSASPTEETSASPFPFFAGNTSSSYPSSTSSSSDETNLEERRRRLGKRLLDMTNKIEDLINQIYRLQQRVEVLERKGGRGY